MTYSFNLIDQPWIPCTMLDGSHTELSLQDTLLQAHEIREIFDQSPLVTAALHRLLLAILHRNFGPSSRPEWQTLWQAGQFDSDRLTEYFSKWYRRFDLFDDSHPFYQDGGIKVEKGRVKEVEINELIPELARANNRTLFDHTTDATSPVLSPPEAARALVATQMYRLAGGKLVGNKYSYDAPISREVCFFVKGSTLFQTLLLNLVPYYGDKPIPVVGNDLPAWEQEQPNTSTTPHGYIDYLTWQTLKLRLVPSQIVREGGEVKRVRIGVGREFDKKQEGNSFFDPGCSYTKNPKAKPDQDPWRATRYEQGRALWRDSAALFRFIENDDRKPLSALKWVSGLIGDGVLDVSTPYQLEAYGQCAKKKDIFFWQSAHLPLPAQYLTNENLVGDLEIALDNTEKVAWYLEQAMEIIARAVLGLPEKDLQKKDNLTDSQKKAVRSFLRHRNVPGGYWSVLEVPFLDCIRRLPGASEATQVWWHDRICAEAEQVFSAATDGLFQSTQKIRAIMVGETFLRDQLRKLRTEVQQDNTSTESDPAENT